MIQTYIVVLDAEEGSDVVVAIYTIKELLELMATGDVLDVYALDIEDNGDQHEANITGKVFLNRIYTKV